MISSLELTVLDDEQPCYQRLISWVVLVASWALMCSVYYLSLKLSRRGLTVRLARTKLLDRGNFMDNVMHLATEPVVSRGSIG